MNTLESGIAVGQEINIGLEKLSKSKPVGPWIRVGLGNFSKFSVLKNVVHYVVVKKKAWKHSKI